jgi:hypothetical protein
MMEIRYANVMHYKLNLLECDPTCLTCTSNYTNCLSCDTLNKNRELISAECKCKAGHFTTGPVYCSRMNNYLKTILKSL